MKVLLDENITPKAREVLVNLGHDVESIHSLGMLGLDDEGVFRLANKSQRILITHNGKHFIIMVPPKVTGVHHYGLLWLKYEMNRKNAENLCNEINEFFLKVKCVKNTIWVLKK